MTGAVLSCTVTICEAEAELPHASVAVHILVMLYSAGQSPGVNESLEDKVNANPHASEAATLKEGEAGQLIVAEGGMAITVGGVISCTLMVWAAVVLFPHPSVAVHVLVMLYSPWQSPGVF